MDFNEIKGATTQELQNRLIELVPPLNPEMEAKITEVINTWIFLPNTGRKRKPSFTSYLKKTLGEVPPFKLAVRGVTFTNLSDVDVMEYELITNEINERNTPKTTFSRWSDWIRRRMGR